MRVRCCISVDAGQTNRTPESCSPQLVARSKDIAPCDRLRKLQSAANQRNLRDISEELAGSNSVQGARQGLFLVCIHTLGIPKSRERYINRSFPRFQKHVPMIGEAERGAMKRKVWLPHRVPCLGLFVLAKIGRPGRHDGARRLG